MTTDWLTKMNSKKVILYVDRYAMFNNVITSFNDDDDYIFSIAFDGNEAIEKAKVLKNKLYLILIGMTIGNKARSAGALYETHIKRILSRDVPVIFQSLKYGLTLNSIFTYRVKRLIDAGIADVILKPYDKEELLTTISKLIAKFGDREVIR